MGDTVQCPVTVFAAHVVKVMKTLSELASVPSICMRFAFPALSCPQSQNKAALIAESAHSTKQHSRGNCVFFPVTENDDLSCYDTMGTESRFFKRLDKPKCLQFLSVVVKRALKGPYASK